MNQKLAMRDFLTFRPKEILENKKYLFECTDEKSPTGSSLLVRLEATHAGIVNGNFRFYRPDRMQASTFGWVLPGRPLKPVLVRHNEDSDPLGRVLKATYVDLSYQYAGEYPIIKDTIFYNTDSKKRFNLFDSVNWIVDHLMPLQDYRGLGYIELGTKITEPEAIRKVLNDEYLTVSVGFETDQALCSICHTDWAVDDRCEHKMGSRVDKKLAHLISGNFDYHEVSFINFPADPFASKIDNGVMADSLNQMFFLGLPISERKEIIHRNQELTDSLNYTADIQVVTPEETKLLEGGPMSETKPDVKPNQEADQTATVDLAKLLDEVNSDKLTPERAFEIQAQLKDHKPATEETKLYKRVVSTVTAVIRKNGWKDKKDVPSKADVERKIASLGDVLRDMSPEARVNYVSQIASQAKTLGIDFTEPNLTKIDPLPEWKLDELPEDEKAYFSDPDKLYDEMVSEMALAAKDGEIELTDQQLTDAKLSTAARKKLKGSTFCGPGRSFPVPDCAHVVAARRLIGRASVGSATKSRILACVSRKAASMGCGGGKKKDEKPEKPLVEQLIKAKLLDALTDEQKPKVPAGFLPALDRLDSEYNKADDGIKYWLGDSINALCEHWRAGRSLAYYKQHLAQGDSDNVVIPAAEHASLQDALAKCEEELKTAKTVIDGWQSTNTTLVESLKLAKAQQIVMFRTVTGVKGYQGLTADQFAEKVSELAKRTRESLEDTLEDVLSQMDGFVAKVADGSKPAEAALTPKDEVVLDPGNPDKKETKPAETPAPLVDAKLEKVKNPNLRRIMENYHRVATPPTKQE